MARFTKGPWRVGDYVDCTSEDGEAGEIPIYVGDTQQRVANVLLLNSDEGETARNARLIAACPALLAAAMDAFVALPMTEHNEPINAALKAAIEMATGREP